MSGMLLILPILGAILGGMLLGGFFGGVIIGALFGLGAGWVLRLIERIDSLQNQLDTTQQTLKRLEKTIADSVREAAAGEEIAPPQQVTPEAPVVTAKAIPPAAKTVREKSPETVRPTVPPATPVPPRPVVPPQPVVPPKPVVPPARETPPGEAERLPRETEPSPPRGRAPARAPELPPIMPEPNVLVELARRWIFGGNPLVKIGVVILFLGLGFALRYAAELGLLPLWLRYVGVAATGVGLIVFGWRWRGREDKYGLVLQGAGVGVLYLTTLSAMRLHPLLPMGPGFTLLFLVAALAAFLAVMEDAMILAVVAALGGFAAPVLASTGAGNHVVLFSYLTVVNLAILAIAWFRRWRLLNILGYVCSFGLGSAWAAEHYRDELFWTTEPFLLLLFGGYVLVTVLFARRTLADAGVSQASTFLEHVRQSSNEVKYVDGSLAFGVPFSAFWLQHLLVAPYQYGTAISAMGFSAFYFLLAYLLSKGTGKRYDLLAETLVALGAVFGTLSIPLLETDWTAAAWSIEAAGVYWIGYRQRQVHVRIFSFLVLIGSAVYFLPELRFATAGTVLDGPILSAALLTGSTGFVYWLMWRSTPDRLYDFEKDLRPIVVGFGAATLATIPLLLFASEWAAVALAIVGTALIYLSDRLSDRTVLGAGWGYQLAGGLLFLKTLETANTGAVLAGGWLGLLGACLLGTALLAGAALVAPNLFTRKPADDASATETPVSMALLAGLAFINLAPLFVLSWRMSAMIWPVVGTATLLWAVRSRHRGVIFFSIGLQGIAGFFHLRTRVIGDAVPALADDAVAFMNSGFVGPLVIALAGLACARLMHGRTHKEESDNSLGWVAIAWGGLWWAFGWVAEITRVVPDSAVTAALIVVTLATAWTWNLLSQRLDWPQLGEAVLVYLPALVMLGARDVLGNTGHPGAGWGALAWPAALVLHGLLLRRHKTRLTPLLPGCVHVVGVWLFIVLATVELRWWLLQWSVPATAWSLVGSMLVPAMYVWAMSRRESAGLVADTGVLYTLCHDGSAPACHLPARLALDYQCHQHWRCPAAYLSAGAQSSRVRLPGCPGQRVRLVASRSCSLEAFRI